MNNIEAVKVYFDKTDAFETRKALAEKGLDSLEAELKAHLKTFDREYLIDIAVLESSKDEFLKDITDNQQVELALKVLQNQKRPVFEYMCAKFHAMRREAKNQLKYLIDDVLSGDINVDQVLLILDVFEDRLDKEQIERLYVEGRLDIEEMEAS